MCAPEKLAALNIGASATETSTPDETTRPRRLAFDRSALVKFARIIQPVELCARQVGTREQFRTEKIGPGKVCPFEGEITQIEIFQRSPGKVGGLVGRCCREDLMNLLAAKICPQSRRYCNYQKHPRYAQGSDHTDCSACGVPEPIVLNRDLPSQPL